jgi:hypothetical protein
MKKIYQKPETLVFEVKTQAMLTMSDKINVGGNYQGGTIGAKDRGEYIPEEDTNSYGDLW